MATAKGEAGRLRRRGTIEKRHRDQRQQRKDQLREEVEVRKRLYSNNPHWEFLSMIKEYRDQIVFNPLRESDPVMDHDIAICIRKRPFIATEVARNEVDVITIPTQHDVVVHGKKTTWDGTITLVNKPFLFDYVFDETCSNDMIYKFTAKSLVENVFEGGVSTCFAYGQSGSGKTHTMGGGNTDCERGLYAMSSEDVFRFLESPKYRDLNLIVSASFFEIYCGEIFDLLANKAKLDVFEDSNKQVQIAKLTEKVVESVDELLNLIDRGNGARTSGKTSFKTHFPRSHAVFQIVVWKSAIESIHGKFSLIDLAGNEIPANGPSMSRKARLEGSEINKSLLVLKECIWALSRPGTHIPFRDSRLTYILRDTFIGMKSKICVIAMINPGMRSGGHTLNTLRYAQRLMDHQEQTDEQF
jgi:kinesin family protein 2/24